MRIRPAVLVFFVVFAVLAVTQGNRFVLTNDEGILLDPAQQIAGGARPYVDFFAIMSPGSYWIQGALFKMFGVSLWTGRIPVLFDFSLQCALLFWLTARLASRRAALAAVVVFAGFQMADPSFLTAQHRWDSSTLALAGLCVALRFPSKRGLAASGALHAAAAWCTPSVALVGAAQALWLYLGAERRRFLLTFFSGILGVTALAAGWLVLQGSFAAFLQQMVWLQRNYSAVNVMPYGSVIGGYARLLDGATGLARILRVVFIVCLALPAILPIAALLLWAVAYLRKRVPPESRPEILLLSLAMVAFALSVFPRADLVHLAFVAAIPYALAAAALARLLTARAGVLLAFCWIPVAVLFSLNHFLGVPTLRPIPSPVGRLRVPADLAPDMRNLLASVRPSQSLYVHPYLPICYFITQARNPTRYSYLNAGMMTNAEESSVLASLQSQPPEWLLYMPLTDVEFRRVFPNAGRARARFDVLEAWLEKSYVPLEQPAVNIGGYRLYRRLAQP